MHTIQEITETHLHCLDDNDYPYIISREHFEQWLKDTGRTTEYTFAPDYTNHIEREIECDWYENMAIDKSNDLKQYCKTQSQFVVKGVEAQRELK